MTREERKEETAFNHMLQKHGHALVKEDNIQEWCKNTTHTASYLNEGMDCPRCQICNKKKTL